MNEERILLRVDFDSDGAKKKVIELEKEIITAKGYQAQLNKEFKEGVITADQYAVASTNIKKSVKDLSTEQSNLSRNISLAEKAQQSATGSNNQAKASILLLTDAYDKLSKEEQDNELIGGKLQKTIRGMSDDLKKNKAALGDNRLNVGNYKQAIVEAVTELGLFGGVSKIAAQAQAQLSEKLTIVKAGFGGSINVLKAFKISLAATGIGLLVLALGALVTFLTSSQKGIDFVNTKLAGLKTIVGFVTKEISDFGEVLFKAFDNPKQAVKDLAEFIVTNLLNRLKSVVVIFNALANYDLKMLNDGLIQAATGVTDATDKTTKYLKELNNVRLQGEAIEKENIRIRDEERKLNLERAQSKALVEQLKFISEDTNKSITERIKATQKAFDIEQGSVNAQIKLQKEKIANLERERKLQNNLTEDNEKLAEEQIKLAELTENSTTRQIELNNKLNSLNAERLKQLEIEKEFLAFKKLLNEAAASDDRKAASDALKRAVDRANKELSIQKDFISKRLANDRKAVDETVAQNQRAADEKERIRQFEIKREEEKFQALSLLGDSLMSLNSLIAGQNAENADFQKAIALFQIGISTAEAIAKGVASAADVPFPGNLVAIATTVATVLANLVQAKSILSDSGDPPKPQFYEGGYTDKGNPKEVATNLGRKSYVYHKNEYVMPDKVLATPQGGALAAAAERLRKAIPGHLPIGGMANGGFGITDGGLGARNIAAGVQDVTAVSNAVLKGISKVKIFTSVTDINNVQRQVNANTAKATL